MDEFTVRSQSPQESSVKSQNAWTSVLSSGDWYKIKIKQSGIYKLTYEDIKSMGFSDPSQVHIFGNGGAMLSLMNSDPRPDDLLENSIYMSKGQDGIFNAGDYILFYGKSPVTWTYNPNSDLFEHKINQYSDASYYFITANSEEVKKIDQAPEVLETPNKISNSFNDFDFHEKNKYNFLKSGRQWFGERMEYNSYDTVFNFPGLITTMQVVLKSNVVSRSANQRTFIYRNGEQFVGSISIAGVVLSNSTGIYANQKSGQFSFSVTGDQVDVNIAYNKIESSDEGFLDYLTLNVRRKLALSGDFLFFRDRTVVGNGNTAKYSVENCNNITEIWDITDFTRIKKMLAHLDGSLLTFIDLADSLREYVVLNPAGNFPKPTITSSFGDLGKIANQNLHAIGTTQLLIISHPLFREAADSIALFHQMKDNMSVQVVTTDQIYNEFSSGAMDVSAIRDFAKMIYNRSTSDVNRLKYLLLLGDGSYNNISRSSGNPNFIPTYQSESSINASTSYASDDFFGLLENEEGGTTTMESFTVDIGVGRLPVKTTYEAMVLYKKIKNYNTSRNMSDWRNNILFIGDDEDGNIHMSQANNLADWVSTNYTQFAVKKVFLDAYKQVSTSTGARYPEVNRIVNDNIQKGTLIVNYTGHGGERGITAEQILMREDLIKQTNSNNLPLFVTATCSFSRFDDVSDDEGNLIESTSAGEVSLLNENGGNIALLSTTRIVYSDKNYYLNDKFYKVVFERDSNGHYYKLGDIIRKTKNNSGINQNKLSFILLGDPALTLAIPEFTVHTDSLNGSTISSVVDTMKAFSRVRISGHIEDIDHYLASSYNGVIYPSVFDKKHTVTTLANDGGDPFQFETQENLLFKGKASVRNGYFSFEFMVPKDITYNFGNGKIVYYSQNSEMDANGYYNQFIIGGTNSSFLPDDNGPEIYLYLNDDNFLDQGISNTSPVIYAEISDASGINTVGNGIGHDITGILDNDVSNPMILNDFFETELNDFTSGILAYPLANLSEGIHSLKVKVWDVLNNSSEKSIEFKVIANGNPVLANIYNYPNPASDITWFRIEHNRPGEEIRVTISVFDMAGRNVAVIQQSFYTTGFSSDPIEWNLKDENGNILRAGVYPYRIRITDSKSKFAESYRKLVIVRH
jgi:hypothetical protein